MLETLSAWEIEALLQYTPDREPTAAELHQLENEQPSRRRQLFSLIQEETTERQPAKKIILSTERNIKGWYERIIFNDWETIRYLDPDYRTPTRKRKSDLIIKLKSELKELYDELRFLRPKLKDKTIPAIRRMKIRTVISINLKEINHLDKLLNKVKYV